MGRNCHFFLHPVICITLNVVGLEGMLFRLFFFSFILCSALFGSFAFADKPGKPIVIAVQTDHRTSLESGFIEDSVRYLCDTLYSVPIVIKPMAANAIIKEASDRKLDFAFLSPDTFASLERFSGARALASQALPPKIEANSLSGATVITSDFPGRIRTLKELANGNVYTTDPDSFFVKIFIRELLQFGVPLPKFKILPASEKPSEEHLIEFVASHPNTTAVLPTGVYEKTIQKLPELASKVVPLRFGGQTESSLITSTMLYPSWTFCAFSSAPNETVVIFKAALLGMEEGTTGYDWAPSPEYESVHELLQTNGDQIYLSPLSKSLREYLKEYWYLFVIPVFIILFMIMHMIRANSLVKKRTRELMSAVNEKRKMEDEVKQYTERLSALERMDIVGELSSMLAHELKQPLAVIHNYARGLAVHAENNNINGSMLRTAIEKIDAQSTKASDIIDHVRSYAKNKNRDVKPIDLSTLTSRAVQNFSIAKGINVEGKITESIIIEASSLEIELLITNLLKNAADAVSEVEKPWIGCTLFKKDLMAVLDISDNGPKLSNEDLKKLYLPLNSTKEAGLGLGLVLVQRIAESSGGSVEFLQREPSGLTVLVSLPIFLQVEDNK